MDLLLYLFAVICLASDTTSNHLAVSEIQSVARLRLVDREPWVNGSASPLFAQNDTACASLLQARQLTCCLS